MENFSNGDIISVAPVVIRATGRESGPTGELRPYRGHLGQRMISFKISVSHARGWRFFFGFLSIDLTSPQLSLQRGVLHAPHFHGTAQA